MVTFNEDRIHTQIVVEEDDKQSVLWKDTQVQAYHSLYKVGSGFPEKLFYNESTRRYIDIRYVQMTNDYSKESDQIYNYEKIYEAR